MNRQSRALLTILIVGALFATYWLMTRRTGITLDAPGRTATDPVERPVRGGTLITTTRTEPRSFNRIAVNQFATELYALLTQGRLVRVHRSSQQLEPWLAERWEQSADGLTFTVSLRDGIVWSDGTPFTSADVVFSFDAAYEPSSASPLASAMTIGGKRLAVTAPDARTVVIAFPEPFAPGMRLFDNLIIVPKHKLESALRAGGFAKAWAAGTPLTELVGLGPFVLSRYDPGQRLVFDRNPRYWRKDQRGEQLPYLDRIVLELIPDQDAELVRLQSGQSDFTQQELRASDLASVRPLEAQGKIRLTELGVTTNPDSFVFNLNPARWTKDPRGAWISRKEFRQAVSHAIDREAFANTVYLGEAAPIHGPVTPGNKEWFWPNVPRYGFSRQRATELLTSIGLRNRDQDEWLEHENGSEARFSVLVFKGNAVLERSAAVIREDLKQVGIAVDVVPLEPNSIGPRLFSNDFDVVFINFQLTDLDPGVSKDLWISSGGAHYFHIGQKTPATEWEAQIDDLMAKQTASFNQDERRRLFNEVQRIWAENLPILYFAAPRIIVAVSSRVTHSEPAPSRPPFLWSPDVLALKNGGR